VNAHEGMTGTTPEQSRLVQSSAVTADTKWHDRQYQMQRTDLTTPMLRHHQSRQPEANQTGREQFLSSGLVESRTEETTGL